MSEDVVEYHAELALATNGHKTPVTRLCALDRLFAAQGTVDVRVGAHMVTLPIQAVDTEQVDALTHKLRPEPPTRSELRGGKTHVIVNEAHPKYQQELSDFTRLSSWVYVLLALAVDVCNEKGEIVWSADNTVHDLEAARTALKHMGMVDNQLVTILTAASNLTRVQEETQMGE